MNYSMKQACAATGLSYDTLKFYCNQGLVPDVQRDANNRRVFDEQCIAWIKSLACLKQCGISITEMKIFVKLCQGGVATIPERQTMLAQKLADLRTKIHELEASITYIHRKQQFYNDVLEGKEEYYSNLRGK